jgi:hypothetical protein
MVYFTENPIKTDENWGCPHDFGNLHLVVAETFTTGML